MKKFITLLLVLTGMVCTANATSGAVYVKASSAPYAYVWDANGVKKAGEWPGTQMSECNLYGVTLYKYEFDYDTDTYYVIINNGSGTQSADSDGKKGTIYVSWDGNGGSKLSVYDPSISQVEIRGSFTGWGEKVMDLSDGAYSTTVDLTTSFEDEEFKIVVKNGSGDYGWLGWNANTWTKTDTESLLSPEGDGTTWDNIVIANSNKAYKTYSVSATFADPTTWSLTFAGADAREHTTYTVYFVDGNSWGDENVYAYTYNNEQSGAWPGTKIARDGDETIEGNSYPKYKYTFEAYEPYPEKIIFNNGSGAQTGNLNLTNNHMYIHGVDMAPVYAVVGSSEALFGSNWDAANTTAWMTGPVDGIYTFTSNNVALDKQTISFKVIKKAYTETETVDAWYPTPNVELAIPVNGKYDVTITFDSEAVDKWAQSSVTATADLKAEKATINPSYRCATFSSSSALDFTSVTGLEAYVATSAEKGYVHMEKVEGSVPANTGLFLTGETDYIPVTEYDTPVANNLLVPTDGNNIYDNTDGKCQYVLANQSEGVAFYRVVKDLSPAAGNAYLSTEGSVGDGASARVAIVFDDEISTGIKSIDNEKLNNGKVYNLNGQEVAQPTKGLYILNGKKVIMK